MKVDPHQEIARRRRLLARCRDSASLRVAVLAECRRDPHYWMDHFAWTYDPRVEPRYLPLVPWDLQRPMVDAVLGRDGCRDASDQLWPLVVEKSRDLGATWVALLAMLWDWLFHAGADYGIMTRSGSELDSRSHQSLLGKIDLALGMLPDWMVPAHDRNRSAHTLVNLDTGSTIIGSLTVRDAFRGQRHKRTLIDEAAAVPDLAAVMASVDDVTRAPLLVSSARGLGNLFGRVANGLDGYKVFEPGERGFGWLKVRLHYSQHPDRQPGTPQGDAWIERERSRRTPERWAQEQEIDYTASVPGRIWPEFDRQAHVYSHDAWVTALGFMRGARLLEGWDFGSGASLTACVRALYLESVDGEEVDTLYVIGYRQWVSATYEQVAADWRAWRWPLEGIIKRVGDVAGKARDSAQRSWLTNLRSAGVPIEAKTLRNGDRVRDLIRVKMSHGKVLFAPACDDKQDPALPTLLDCVEQYRREVKGDAAEHVGKAPPPRKDIYSHSADCLQYIADVVWPGVRARMQDQDEPPR